MKTLTLILSLALVLASATVGAQQAEVGNPKPDSGLISLEAINEDGTAIRGVVNSLPYDDDHLQRACCVQPQKDGFKSALISAIESLAVDYTNKVLTNDGYINVCDKAGFIAAINSSAAILEFRNQFKGGVVLQVRRNDVAPSALFCLSR